MKPRHKDKSLYLMKKKASQARSQATVDAILSAATQVLLAVGYDQASTNKIADRAGVSIGSLYEYFPGKEAIFAEVRRLEDQKLFNLVMSQTTPDTVKEVIHLHISVYLEFVRSNLALHSALINDVPQFAVEANELPFYRDYVPWLTEFVSAHRDELRLSDDVASTVDFITRVSRATIDNYVLYSPESLNQANIETLMIDLLERFFLLTR